jgi:hypothetical protein
MEAENPTMASLQKTRDALAASVENGCEPAMIPGLIKSGNAQLPIREDFAGLLVRFRG